MLKKFLATAAFIATSSTASAAVVTSTDMADFNLTSEPFPLQSSGTSSDLVSTSGNVTLRSAGVGNPPSSTQFYKEWPTSALAGNEYAISGDESFDVLFSSDQTAFAFNYSDDSIVSTFSLSFFDGASPVGTASFTTSAPFMTAQFIGFISDDAFDLVEIRENDGSENSNEYFQFYTATPAEVPLPAAAWLFGSALLGLGVIKRKRSVA